MNIIGEPARDDATRMGADRWYGRGGRWSGSAYLSHVVDAHITAVRNDSDSGQTTQSRAPAPTPASPAGGPADLRGDSRRCGEGLTTRALHPWRNARGTVSVRY